MRLYFFPLINHRGSHTTRAGEEEYSGSVGSSHWPIFAPRTVRLPPQFTTQLRYLPFQQREVECLFMELQSATPEDLAAIVTALNNEQGWGLDLEAAAHYANALHRHIEPNADAAQVRRVCTNYHHDHLLVGALINQGHRLHLQVWQDWSLFALRTLYQAGLVNLNDPAVGAEDLAQESLTALRSSLAHFRYESRLKTWAYAVIVKTVKRIHRDRNAQKRPRNLTSLDQDPRLAMNLSDQTLLEHDVYAALLIELVRHVLRQAGSERMVTLFEYAMVRDLSSGQIARIVQLHPSRVRALLNQTRSLLQCNHSLRSWVSEMGDAPSAL